MKVAFVEKRPAGSHTLAVGVLAERVLTPAAREVDREIGGALTRAVRSGRFDGTRG